MKIDILTLFPEMFAPLKTSIIGKAVDGGILDIRITDIRQYTRDKHHKCDDYPFGGGAGMVMMPQPIFDAVNAVDPERKSLRIYMSPKGKTLNMPIVKRLAGENRDLLLLCGHYEGVDQRVLDLCFDEEISIGDYVLTGGELPAMMIADAVCRLVPGGEIRRRSSRQRELGQRRNIFREHARVSAIHASADFRGNTGSRSFALRASRQCRKVAETAIGRAYQKAATGLIGGLNGCYKLVSGTHDKVDKND